MDRSAPQIFPFGYGLPCDTFGCYRPAQWQVGRPDGPVASNHRLCEKCAESIAANLPSELRPLEPPATAQPSRLIVVLGDKGGAVVLNAATGEKLGDVDVPEGQTLAYAPARAAEEATTAADPVDSPATTPDPADQQTETCVCGRSFEGKMAKQHLGRHQQTCPEFAATQGVS